jgi:excisionase family DNA binding protein
MSERVALPLPDGRWLSLDRETFHAALAAGAEFSPPVTASVAPSGPRLLTSDQLAERLNIPATWLEEAARRDEVPAVRIGKYVRFNLDDVLATLDPRIASARVSRKPMIQKGQKPVLRNGSRLQRAPGVN